MELVHKRDIIRKVPKRWQRQYKGYDSEGSLIAGAKTMKAIQSELDGLDTETCTDTDIDNVIGVRGWAANECDECATDCETLVRFGDEPDYDARWQDLCLRCLSKAIRLLKGATK